MNAIIEAPSAPSAPAPYHHKIPITILICDDDEDDRILTRAALEGARISNSLRFVADGEQLLDYLYQRGEYAGETGSAPRPGLILLDLNMPNMDGREALRRIKSDPALSDIPVVVLSVSELEDDNARSSELGVTGYIMKPVTFRGLLDAMNILNRYWIQLVEVLPAPHSPSH